MIIQRNGKVIGKLEAGVFSKKINESKHLLYSFGSVPAIDANTFDFYKNSIGEIVITTNKRRIFKISGQRFDETKKTIDFGWGKQYVTNFENWKISEESNAGRLL